MRIFNPNRPPKQFLNLGTRGLQIFRLLETRITIRNSCGIGSHAIYIILLATLVLQKKSPNLQEVRTFFGGYLVRYNQLALEDRQNDNLAYLDHKEIKSKGT